MKFRKFEGGGVGAIFRAHFEGGGVVDSRGGGVVGAIFRAHFEGGVVDEVQ